MTSVFSPNNVITSLTSCYSLFLAGLIIAPCVHKGVEYVGLSAISLVNKNFEGRKVAALTELKKNIKATETIEIVTSLGLFVISTALMSIGYYSAYNL